jgi:hypothetical protein
MIIIIAAVVLAIIGLEVAYIAWRSFYGPRVYIGSLVLGFGAAGVLLLVFGPGASSKQSQAAKQSPAKAAVPIKSATPAPAVGPTVKRKPASKPKHVKRKVRKHVHSVRPKLKHAGRKHRKHHKAAVVRKPSLVRAKVTPAYKPDYHRPAHRTTAVRTHSAPPIRNADTPPPIVTAPAPVRRTAPSSPSGPPLRIGNGGTGHKAPSPKPSAPLGIG